MMMHVLEAGAEDMTFDEKLFEIFTHPHEFETVKTTLEQEGFTFEEADIRWVPQSTIKVEGEQADKLLKMMEAFEDNDDVQDVYVNFEIDQ
jgi:transcriptional/translational regulatory protein YebC/TACO1